jgi:hypothetical protein
MAVLALRYPGTTPDQWWAQDPADLATALTLLSGKA